MYVRQAAVQYRQLQEPQPASDLAGEHHVYVCGTAAAAAVLALCLCLLLQVTAVCAYCGNAVAARALRSPCFKQCSC
jgi:hypothetical protein